MIKICPSITEYTLEEARRQLEEYLKNFDHVDIDIVEDGNFFKAKNTLNVHDINSILKNIKTSWKTIGVHIMADNPFHIMNDFKNNDLLVKTRYYIHQESIVSSNFVDDINDNEAFGIVLNPNTDLRNIEFYDNFYDVQIMTVEPGKQGNQFIEKTLEKSLLLREKGYDGLISVDGGVNLDTAAIIKRYPIDRVSVGSYFSKAKDIKQALLDLDLALNRKL